MMADEIKHIEDEFKGLSQREMLLSLKLDIAHVKQQLDGNGEPGLMSRVRNNEKWRYMITGALILLAGALGISLGGLI